MGGGEGFRYSHAMTLRRCILTLVALAVLALVWGMLNARADPVVRRVAVPLTDWPGGAAPVTVALISDIHLASPAMDEDRLRRIVGQVNALHPDLVAIAGDFVDGWSADRGQKDSRGLIVPLRGLRAPLGTVAVLGNHDHATAPRAIRAALQGADITVLANEAAQRGPLVIMGLDDAATALADVGRTFTSATGLTGARVTLTHDSQFSPYMPAELSVLLAGHSHCGQIVLPLIGPLGIARTFDQRYLCGLVREPHRTTIVSAGLGTSILPLRFGAPPDIWLIRFGPAAIRRPSR